MNGSHRVIGHVLRALQRGAAAFEAGLPRAGNPHDPSSEEWMCWRDGWEQAKAAAALVSGSRDGLDRTSGEADRS